MSDQHPNLALMNRLDLRNLSECADLFAPDFDWHYVNRNLPDIVGDYKGLEGLQAFFALLAEAAEGQFEVQPIALHTCGDELVVVHVRNSLRFKGRPVAVDAVVVWRIVGGRFAEAWDIPSTHTLATPD